MIEYERKALQGVPDYRAAELLPKRSDYCLLIPVINEGARILTELGRAQTAGVDTLCDIVICDGGSTDGSMKLDTLQLYGVNTLLTKTGPGKQGAQLRMGIYFALNRGYNGVLTIEHKVMPVPVADLGRVGDQFSELSRHLLNIRDAQTPLVVGRDFEEGTVDNLFLVRPLGKEGFDDGFIGDFGGDLRHGAEAVHIVHSVSSNFCR